MSSTEPFSPHYGSGQNVAPAAASAAITIGASGTTSSSQVRIANTGTNPAYIRTFNSRAATDTPAAGVATTADYIIPPNSITTFTRALDHDRLAHISASGTTLNIITGNGR